MLQFVKKAYHLNYTAVVGSISELDISKLQHFKAELSVWLDITRDNYSVVWDNCDAYIFHFPLSGFVWQDSGGVKGGREGG